MAQPPRDPFANFERVRREVDDLFGGVLERTGLTARRGFSPRVDVYHCGEPPRAVVKAELAGIDLDRLGLEISGRQLLIAGERRAQEPEGRRYQQVEIEHGPFRRVVELGADVEAELARATYEDGILRVEVPLAQATRGVRRVPLQGAAAAGDEPEAAE